MALSVEDFVSLKVNRSLYPEGHELYLLEKDGFLYFSHGARYFSPYTNLFGFEGDE